MANPIRKIPAPSKTWGGKAYLCTKLLRMSDRSKSCYIDLFGGGGVMTLSAANLFAERTYNDIDWQKCNFLACVREWPNQLVETLRRFPYAVESFIAAKACNELHVQEGYHPPADAEEKREYMLMRATRWFIRNRMSRVGLGESFAWSERLRGGRPGDLNAWMNTLDRLPLISQRLRGVTILSCDFKDVLTRSQAASVMWYMDPPYLPETRVTTDAYGPHEMSPERHAELLDLCLRRDREGDSIMISGYMSELYHRKLHGWNVHRITLPNHSAQNGKKNPRVECVWTNYRN